MPASSMLLVESCVSGRKPQLRIVCMSYMFYLYDSASYVVGTDVLSRGVMRPRRKVYRTPPSNAEAKNEWSYTSPSICFHGVDRANFIDAFDIYPLTPQVDLMYICIQFSQLYETLIHSMVKLQRFSMLQLVVRRVTTVTTLRGYSIRALTETNAVFIVCDSC